MALRDVLKENSRKPRKYLREVAVEGGQKVVGRHLWPMGSATAVYLTGKAFGFLREGGRELLEK